MSATPTSREIEAVVEATSIAPPAPTSSTTGSSETAQAEAAPSYEEIRSRIRSIMFQFTPNPNSRDIEEPEELLIYYRYLKDKRAQDWQGWVPKLNPADEPMFGLDIYMEIPKEEKVDGRDPLGHVKLHGVPLEQREQLMQWQEAQSGVRWYKVSFSGRISAINGGGQVFLGDGTISPMDP